MKTSVLCIRRKTREDTMSPELQKVNALGVHLHDRRIGIINRLAGDSHIFAFEQDYIDDPNRPTLSLSYKSRTGGLVTTVRPVSRHLPPFFSNLLPEGHLRRLSRPEGRSEKGVGILSDGRARRRPGRRCHSPADGRP